MQGLERELDIAREMLRRGWLWNTLVVVAKVSHLVRLALTHCPETVGPLLLTRNALGGPAETAVVARAYAQARPAKPSKINPSEAHAPRIWK